MASIFQALSDFVHGIYTLILSVLQTIYSIFETAISMVINFFTSIIALVGDTFKGVFNVLGGVGNFFIANAAIIGVIAVGGYAYLAYQRRQGNTVTVQGKKLN